MDNDGAEGKYFPMEISIWVISWALCCPWTTENVFFYFLLGWKQCVHSKLIYIKIYYKSANYVYITNSRNVKNDSDVTNPLFIIGEKILSKRWKNLPTPGMLSTGICLTPSLKHVKPGYTFLISSCRFWTSFFTI